MSRRSASRGWCAASRAAAARVAVVAFVTAFIFFLQLRIADEFKDYEDDLRYRPYRPVPRGLVTLRELGWIGVAGGAAIQLGLALWLHPPLVAAAVLAWAYLALMSREFFAAAWLRRRPGDLHGEPHGDHSADRSLRHGVRLAAGHAAGRHAG